MVKTVLDPEDLDTAPEGIRTAREPA